MVTEIKWRDSWIHRLLLFQSAGQMASWLVCVLIVYLVIVVCASLGGATTIKAEYFVVGLIGTLPALYGTLPCIFSVSGASKHKVQDVLDRAVASMGYVLVESDDAGRIYGSKLPRILRWEENRIVVRFVDAGVEVQAPKLVAEKIRKKIIDATAPSAA